jgi:hypothetical protein
VGLRYPAPRARRRTPEESLLMGRCLVNIITQYKRQKIESHGPKGSGSTALQGLCTEGPNRWGPSGRTPSVPKGRRIGSLQLSRAYIRKNFRRVGPEGRHPSPTGRKGGAPLQRRNKAPCTRGPQTPSDSLKLLKGDCC